METDVWKKEFQVITGIAGVAMVKDESVLLGGTSFELWRFEDRMGKLHDVLVENRFDVLSHVEITSTVNVWWIHDVELKFNQVCHFNT